MRSDAGSATSTAPRTRSAAPSSSAANPSPDSRCCDSRRETSTRRRRSSPASLDEITWDRLARARLLPARAQIAIAAGDLPGAAAALDELESIASDFASPALIAATLSTRGRIQLASNDRSACATLRQAAERWQELGVPHEVATARMLHGAACRQAGDLDGATTSFEAARTLFEQLGAALDLRNLRDITETTRRATRRAQPTRGRGTAPRGSTG